MSGLDRECRGVSVLLHLTPDGEFMTGVDQGADKVIVGVIWARQLSMPFTVP